MFLRHSLHSKVIYILKMYSGLQISGDCSSTNVNREQVEELWVTTRGKCLHDIE